MDSIGIRCLLKKSINKDGSAKLKSQVKSIILKFLKTLLPIVRISRTLSKISRKIAYQTHRIQMFLEWTTDNPEHFDHNIDLYYKWRRDQQSFPMERGVWSSLALRGDGNTLDLCCGDGFYSFYFYSSKSKQITAIDFEPKAIQAGKQNFSLTKIKYVLGDIRKDIPAGPFDNIVWDAAIEHFTENEIISLMTRIKTVLTPSGILSGYTIVEDHAHNRKRLHQHEYEFHSKEDLARFLTPYFKNVMVAQTTFEDRENLYFYASDELLPFEGPNFLISHQ